MKKISVIGAGTMGAGIAQIAIEAGYQVWLRDIEDRFVEKGIGTIKRFLSRKLEKEKITKEQYEDTFGRLSGTTDLKTALKGAELVVEAVLEKMDLKKEVFKELGNLCDKDTVLATNTSTLSITEIASAARYPERVVGTHFFNPVPLMRLVEVVKGEKTSEEVVKKSANFCETVGKTPIIVKDVGRFIDSVKQEGMTVLLSEQNVKFSLKHSDRAYIVDSGHIKYTGTIKELEKDEEIKKRYLAV